MKRTLAIALVAAGALITGCGGGEPAQDRYDEALFRAEIARSVSDRVTYCAGVALGSDDLAERRVKAVEGIDGLIKIAREDPDRVYASDGDGSRTVRQVLADEANELADCDPDLAQRVQRGLDTL